MLCWVLGSLVLPTVSLLVPGVSAAEGVQAKSCKAVRVIGLREKILREKIQEFENRGCLIEVDPNETEWVSWAFLVSKPNGKWRLVIDYQWLNSQLKGQNFPLPVIEDQLAKQRGNFIWTLVDLEDGFHQMRLAPSSQPLTAFIAPFCLFQWTVLPMAVKVGPQVFQRMVAHVLRGCHPASSPYMDDVLTGTGKPPPPPSSGKGQVRDSQAYEEASQQTPELFFALNGAFCGWPGRINRHRNCWTCRMTRMNARSA